MAEINTVFIPFGEWQPDKAEFGHDGLLVANGLAPLGDTYVPTSNWEEVTAVLPATPTGAWVHATDLGAGFTAYAGTDTALYEFSATNSIPWTRTTKTRAVGGAYSAAASASGWQGASYGNSVIMTNYTDDPQYLLSPASANFVKLAASTFDPKARFVFPVRQSIVLAYLNLALAFDGLSAGANPYTVCWSQSGVPTQFGSANVTPQLIGAGYQLLAFDLGYITGGIGGEYGLIAMQRGWVRMDGPPYTFRPISEGTGCIYPNSIVRLGDDVYFWGPGGPMVLRGGDGRAVSLTTNRLIRTLSDRISAPSLTPKFDIAPIYVSAAADHVNNHVWFSYVPSDASSSPKNTITLIYDATNDRFTIGGGPEFLTTGGGGIHFMNAVPTPIAADVLFVPGRDITGALFDSTSSDVYMGQASQANGTRSVTFTTGFRRLSDTNTTRVRRVRLIYSLSSATGGDNVAVTITSKNKPYATANSAGPYSALDSHGAIPTTGSYTADFHKLTVTLDANTLLTLEISGLEIQYETAGEYSE